MGISVPSTAVAASRRGSRRRQQKKRLAARQQEKGLGPWPPTAEEAVGHRSDGLDWQ
jgi:hypothetical protein